MNIRSLLLDRQIRFSYIKAPRPKGLGFPARWFNQIVPLDPVLKDGACGALSGQPVQTLEKNSQLDM